MSPSPQSPPPDPPAPPVSAPPAEAVDAADAADAAGSADAGTPDGAAGGVTGLLVAWGAGDRAALDALVPLVHEELRRIARAAMRREAMGHTLQPTALVHEAYLRLVDQRRVELRNREQFYGVAARLMRRVLIDAARARHAEKRGGAGGRPVTLHDAGAAADEPDTDALDVLALHTALKRLGAMDPELERLVELRYFGGLTIEAASEALGVSPATLKRQWAVARAWLRRELGTSRDA